MDSGFGSTKAMYTDTTDANEHKQYKVLHNLASGRYGDVKKVEWMTADSNDTADANKNDSKQNGQENDKKQPEKEENNVYALKFQEIFDGELPSKLQREIDIMSQFASNNNHNHPNIIQMMSYWIEDNHLLFLLPFYDSNLEVLLQNAPLKMDLIKHIMHGTLEGLSYIHSLNIIHRDIKPNNILYHTQTQRVVIADFGSARDITMVLENVQQSDIDKEHKDEIPDFDDPEWSGFDTDTSYKLTPQIYVVPYRAPELLLGERHYRFGVDIWAMGCIMAQMCRVNGKLLFDEQHDIPQFMQHIQILGGPKDNELQNVGLFSVFFTMEQSDYNPMNKVVDLKDDIGCDLLSKLLRLGPQQRITAQQALSHSFFDEMQNNQ